MDYEEVKSYLYSLMNYGASYGIDRMRLLAEAIGHPEKEFPVFHVAGTNGKGSVCAMLEAIYRRNGYRVGLFTSPHLVKLEERIQVNRHMISQKELIAYVENLKTIGEDLEKKAFEMRPSMFEIMTAIGFLYFAKSKIDIGIIETGLGGRFDSTNIVDPEIAIITSISRDHTEILGDSLEEIAYAKGGIIKPGKPVVIGLLSPEAESVIRAIAFEQNAPVFSVEEVYGKNRKNYPETVLKGDYQRSNAAIALLTTQVLNKQFPIDEKKAKEALQLVDWAGRWQIVKMGRGTLILDCAHNEEGAEGLAKNLESLIKEEGRKPIIAVSSLNLYRAKAIMKVVSSYAEDILLIKPNNPKALDCQLLKEFILPEFKGTVEESSIEKLFLKLENNRTMIVTGSIYLVGEVLERIENGGPCWGRTSDQGIMSPLL